MGQLEVSGLPYWPNRCVWLALWARQKCLTGLMSQLEVSVWNHGRAWNVSDFPYGPAKGPVRHLYLVHKASQCQTGLVGQLELKYSSYTLNSLYRGRPYGYVFWANLAEIHGQVHTCLCLVLARMRSKRPILSIKSAFLSAHMCELVREFQPDWPKNFLAPIYHTQPYLKELRNFTNSDTQRNFYFIMMRTISNWHILLRTITICIETICDSHLDVEERRFTVICITQNFLTTLNYLNINWKKNDDFYVMIIYYRHVCYKASSISFSIHYFHVIMTSKVTSIKSLKHWQPRRGNASCVVVFVCIYYFMVAAGMWLIILSYAWNATFKSLAGGSVGEELERRAAYFHLLAWSIPLVLTITTLALALMEVSADYLSGVCFLVPSLLTRVMLLIIPLIIVAIIAGYFLAQGLRTLIHLKSECSNIISDKANSKILETIVRMVVFTASLFIFLAISIYCHVYYHQNYEDWEKSLRKYIMCSLNISSLSDSAVAGYPGGPAKCVIESRPSMALYKLHLLAFFGLGIAMSSWVWTPNTLDAWRRFLRRVLGINDDHEVHLAKHKVIAQAFAKRHHLNNIGRLSISLHSMHHDPVGLNFDVNSGTSGDMSSAWAKAIPQLMARRGAVAGTAALTIRRNSVDSEYSISRRFSIESGAAGGRGSSRRHSLDSQLSFHVSDVERLAAIHTAARFGSRRKRREWFSLRRGKNKKVTSWDRRGSNTSDDSNLTSNLGSMILPAITLNQETLFANMMKRLNLSSEDPTRSEIGGVSPSASPTKSLNQQTNTPSDEETGAENPAYIESDSMCQTITKYEGDRRKRRKNSYLNSSVALEEGLLHQQTRDMAIQAIWARSSVDMMDVGVQASFPISVTTILTSNKSCQVSTPLLVRASCGKNTRTP
ncbi:unnamed protein product, partial [Meganyctiphanes norvegica]